VVVDQLIHAFLAAFLFIMEPLLKSLPLCLIEALQLIQLLLRLSVDILQRILMHSPLLLEL
jgi:hypothetical protein